MGYSIGVVIPTYGREHVLVETLETLTSVSGVRQHVILVDQTPEHEEATVTVLKRAERAGWLRWVRCQQPSIPQAMNAGLCMAPNDVVLFLDDDIIPDADLIAEHLRAHEDHPDAWAVVGQVLQPGEEPAPAAGYVPKTGFYADLDFPFWSDQPAWVSNVMAGNLSVKRDRAIEIGGFDEQFSGVAYRFETEFARRLIASGGRIRFEPKASIRHLQAARGGTRAAGSHLSSASPRYGMGDYYFAMRSGWNLQTLAYIARRPLREIRTRFHLSHPWYIPVKLLGEARAFWAALSAHRKGPKLIAGERGAVDS